MFRKLINWILITRLKRKLQPFRKLAEEIPGYYYTQDDLDGIYKAFPNYLLKSIQQTTLPKRKIYYPGTLIDQLDVLEKFLNSVRMNSTINANFVKERVIDKTREQLLTTILRGDEPAVLIASAYKNLFEIEAAILRTPESRHHHFRSRTAVSLTLFAELLLGIGDTLANPEG